MTRIKIHYEGQLHCRLTHSPSGSEIQTDAPVDNQGKGEAFSPTDLVGAALGSCMATIMAMAAEKSGIDCKGTHITVEKTMSSDLPRRISEINVDIHVPLSADHPKRALLEKAALNCPVHHSLHPEIKQNIVFHWR